MNFVDKKEKEKNKIEPIKYKVSNLEKTLKLSNEKIIAEAIKDILKRENQNGH